MALGIKKFTMQALAGACVANAVAMLLVGLSDRLNPAEHPILANAGLAFPFFILLNLGFLLFFLFTKKRYALLPFAGFIVCYFPIRTFCPFNFPASPPTGALKILSYNVYSFGGRDLAESGPNPITDYIIRSGADIVCLQEARLDNPAAAPLKEKYEYCDSALAHDNGESVMLLSKYPILSKETIKYESKGNVSAAFTLKIGKDTVVVVNNHLETSGLSPADRAKFKSMVKGNEEADSMRRSSKRILVQLGEAARTRAPQAKAVARYVAKCRYPVILCGDFNDVPISYAHRTIAKELTDCFVTTGNGLGISYHKNAFFVRIDNIMCSKEWKPYGCKVDRSIAASDHYPIFCWLKRLPKDKNQK